MLSLPLPSALFYSFTPSSNTTLQSSHQLKPPFSSLLFSGTSEVFSDGLGAMSPAGFSLKPSGLVASIDNSFYSQATPGGTTQTPSWCGPATGKTRILSVFRLIFPFFVCAVYALICNHSSYTSSSSLFSLTLSLTLSLSLLYR